MASSANAGHVRAAPADPLGDALALAYRSLGRRDRTVSEVRSYLLNHGCEEAVADEAVAELREQGYLDDERYARRFAEDRRTLDGWGGERIARRLDDAGVPAPVIEATLADRDSDDELAAALGVLRGKLVVPPADDRARERALGLLVRRGYELELAYDAVRAFEREAA
jgi:regulatory protein